MGHLCSDATPSQVAHLRWWFFALILGTLFGNNCCPAELLWIWVLLNCCTTKLLSKKTLKYCFLRNYRGPLSLSTSGENAFFVPRVSRRSCRGQLKVPLLLFYRWMPSGGALKVALNKLPMRLLDSLSGCMLLCGSEYGPALRSFPLPRARKTVVLVLVVSPFCRPHYIHQKERQRRTSAQMGFAARDTVYRRFFSIEQMRSTHFTPVGTYRNS